MSEPAGKEPLIRGEFAPDDFYRALGCAIVTFSTIDGALWRLFWALGPNDPPDHVAARAIFYSSRQFGGRLDKVAALAGQKIIDPEMQAEWTDIHSLVSVLKDERNHLAHSDAAADFEHDNTFGLALVRPMHMPEEKYTPPKAKLDTRRLEELVRGVRADGGAHRRVRPEDLARPRHWAIPAEHQGCHQWPAAPMMTDLWGSSKRLGERQ